MNSPTLRNTSASTSPQAQVRLRLGVLLDSYQVPAWIYDLLRKLSSSEAIDLRLVMVDQNSQAAAGTNRTPILFKLWAALDRRVRRSAAGALRRRNCGPLLSSLSEPPVVLRVNLADGLARGDVASIKAANLDLLLHLGHAALQPEVVDCTELGVWELQDESGALGQFWDIYDGHPVFEHGPQVIERTRTQTRTVYKSRGITGFLSLALNQNEACWNLAEFLARSLADVPTLREEGRQLPAVPVTRRTLSPRTLGNARMAGFLMRWAMRAFRHELQKRLFREQWLIVLQAAPGMKKFNTVSGARYVRPSKDRFYADPFLVERHGRTYLFFEDYRFATKKGVISCCEVDNAGNCGQPCVVLEREYHLSYPFLFEWQGEIYLLPESRDNRTIEMYRASDFPHSWTREAVLMEDVAAVDSTLLEYSGKWWLFAAGIQEDITSPNDGLYLYFADSPLGPWTAHPKNPIVSDARRARPAGRLYFKNGALIRPGQDCANGYGYAIQLHRVDVLSETDYCETPLSRITPSWIPGSLGTHTINQSEKLRVMDARFLIPRFQFFPFLSRWLTSARRRDFGGMDLAADQGRRGATTGSTDVFVRESGRNSR